jgi:hypothetical protein
VLTDAPTRTAFPTITATPAPGLFTAIHAGDICRHGRPLRQRLIWWPPPQRQLTHASAGHTRRRAEVAQVEDVTEPSLDLVSLSGI